MKWIRSAAMCAIAVGAAACSFDAAAGAIAGRVVFEGEPPAMPVIDMDVDPACTAKHTDPVRAETLVLGEGQTMANILIQITDGRPESPAAPAEPVVLTQEGCRYSPHVVVVRTGQPLTILNPDTTLHNVHGMAKKNPEFNKSMTKAVTDLTLKFETAEAPFALKCQVHPWMTAYCAVLDHAYYAVTGADGKYEIANLPPGNYTIEAWHERLGTQTATVTVADGAAVQDFSFSRPKRN